MSLAAAVVVAAALVPLGTSCLHASPGILPPPSHAHAHAHVVVAAAAAAHAHAVAVAVAAVVAAAAAAAAFGEVSAVETNPAAARSME